MRVSAPVIALGTCLVCISGYLGSVGLFPGSPAALSIAKVELLEQQLALHKQNNQKRQSLPDRPRGIQVPKSTTAVVYDGPGSTCKSSAVVVVGILSSATEKGTKLRTVLRETWFNLADKNKVELRFIMGFESASSTPSNILEEAKKFEDMLLLPVGPGSRQGYSGNGPSNLLERVQAFFRWTVASCANLQYVLKSDDDCYVAVDRLLRNIEHQAYPSERLYLGRFLNGMPAKDKTGKPDTDNYQKLHDFPNYAGAGYLVTPDVAKYIGNPGLPMLFHRVEDRGIGTMLYGFNLTVVNAEKAFQPWGNCYEESIWIHHFQKDPALMRRRYERARDGKNICGEGWAPDVRCAMAEQGKHLELTCPAGTAIAKVLFASYGRHMTSAPGPCAEGPSGWWPSLVLGVPLTLSPRLSMCVHMCDCVCVCMWVCVFACTRRCGCAGGRCCVGCRTEHESPVQALVYCLQLQSHSTPVM
eukprot:m.343931 g.343931  ORF g.343931 m.343931 type:complete len:472 (-) comp20639_c0_seq2:749-2164(-)